jgi:1,4-alpha-glucan branching enzyme
MYGHPGKKLLFMGGEFGQWREWNYSESLDWHLLDVPGEEGERHQGVRRLIKAINRLYREHPALHEVDFDWRGFEWIDFTDADNSVIAFQRRARDGAGSLIFVCNFTPVVRYNYRLGLPRPGQYRELLNTDAEEFGGSGVVHTEPIEAEPVAWHGRPCSATMTLPPLATFVLE